MKQLNKKDLDLIFDHALNYLKDNHNPELNDTQNRTLAFVKGVEMFFSTSLGEVVPRTSIEPLEE